MLGHILKERRLAIRGKSGIQIAVRVWGEDPRTITNPAERWIAVHGWLDNAGSFDFLAPLLLKRGAKSIACIDLAGHGQSDWRSTGTYHVVDNVADVIYTADALEWKQFSLIGHSLGGCISQTIAAAMPDRVLRLVSIEAMGFWAQEAAMTMVERGTRKSDCDMGYIWVDEIVARSILSHIECPQLIIVCRDGIWKDAAPFGLTLFSVNSCLAYQVLCAEISKEAGVIGKIRFVYMMLFRRWLVCRTSKFVHMNSGGHHPHLMEPEEVAGHIGDWLGKEGGDKRLKIKQE
ncbi:hypothetical protein GUITHDRAFT_120992 [Guillardia theta CCMP2712]|uniref:AB hydrolase-1 domain-containing protein n=1 Tax=Guillardia theta (strain CCMP2712) TaxID=905079 RepID=L1I9T7_GUITC|nr:hypothetical protein GUITHDRAFT_120992 [Guillardia theta CCMP2712]EKX32842.1 hypothetical protein GUITHDRAFT_120992 [Guillardia theta CCMP2712]|eukprot:XP_005819822.1 hypothetical protein GUITHDRAFT_120992 [Guillardia theta CCMP2712]